MAVGITIKSNAKSVQKTLDRFFQKYPSITRKGLLQASFQLQAIMKELTSKQLDFRRNKFAPYSDSYLKRLQKEGKSQKVDLFFTGRMLGSLTGKVQTSKRASVFFNNAEMRRNSEEIKIIIPAIKKLKSKGINISNILVSDTVFIKSYKKTDYL